MLGLILTVLFVPSALQSAQAISYDDLQGLTYLQVKGSGIANTCPVLEGGSTNLKDLKAGSYKLEKFCMEPTQFLVKDASQFKGGEAEFVKTKLMTRLTYTLAEVHTETALFCYVNLYMYKKAPALLPLKTAAISHSLSDLHL